MKPAALHLRSDADIGAPSGTSVSGTSVSVTIRGLRKSFSSGQGAVHAVDGVDLDIVEGEFFCLLGPSGSGKTTLLRMIAGFEIPTAGTIALQGVDVTRLAPFDRDVNTVFQDYALFPHMTVAQNVEYGLKVKRVPRAERALRVAEALETVQLAGYGARKPSQLSGGQRQRIALARALINRPKVLLLDEPLGALDLKLRQQMQVELKTIQAQVGITFIFVTHDQEEALTMSDRIAVFNTGRIEQIGTPAEIYERPASAFVARFVGTSNVVEGDAAAALMGETGVFAIRPERIRLLASVGPPSDDEIAAAGIVQSVEYLGPHLRTRVELDVGPTLLVQTPNNDELPTPVAGQRVMLAIRRDHAYSIL